MVHELAGAGIEGGSPSLIWQRWTLPMYAAQQRYWADHPRTDQLVAAYLGVKPKKTPPPGKAPVAQLNWALLDAPDAVRKQQQVRQ